MSVGTHLTETARNAVLSGSENTSIGTSISTLQTRLNRYFDSGQLSGHFTFGSYTRDTILPRKLDSSSDVDYMVVFKEGGSKPQTYLDRLKKFVEKKKYTSSEISQSHPTIKLELSHIKFELVPAIVSYGSYQIPAPSTGWSEWISTDPNGFNTTLTDANKNHGYNIKPLVRLVKIWNASSSSGHVYDSYALEKHLVNTAYSHGSLREYFYAAIDGLSLNWNEAQWRRDKLDRAKEIVKNTRDYERQGMEYSAEAEIKKLLPPV